MGIQWMVDWWVLVYSGCLLARKSFQLAKLSLDLAKVLG
jgi:hypothetical protein